MQDAAALKICVSVRVPVTFFVRSAKRKRRNGGKGLAFGGVVQTVSESPRVLVAVNHAKARLCPAALFPAAVR